MSYYDIESLKSDRACKIVFFNYLGTANELKEFITEERPEYISEINKKLLPYRKIGPFRIKNKKSLFKRLRKTLEGKMAFKSKGAEGAVSFIEEELDKMDLDRLAYRAPVAMSELQRLRASCLYDVFNLKFHFLLCDCEGERIKDREKRIRSKSAYFTIAEYIRHRANRYGIYDLVWITNLRTNEMFELLGNSAKEEGYGFFALVGNEVFELDKEKLLTDYAEAQNQNTVE